MMLEIRSIFLFPSSLETLEPPITMLIMLSPPLLTGSLFEEEQALETYSAGSLEGFYTGQGDSGCFRRPIGHLKETCYPSSTNVAWKNIKLILLASFCGNLYLALVPKMGPEPVRLPGDPRAHRDATRREYRSGLALSRCEILPIASFLTARVSTAQMVDFQCSP